MRSFAILSLTSTRDRRAQKAYRVHRFDIRMASDRSKLEQFLNDLEGVVVAVTPNVTIGFLWIPRVDLHLVVEKIARVSGS